MNPEPRVEIIGGTRSSLIRRKLKPPIAMPVARPGEGPQCDSPVRGVHDFHCDETRQADGVGDGQVDVARSEGDDQHLADPDEHEEGGEARRGPERAQGIGGDGGDHDEHERSADVGPQPFHRDELAERDRDGLLPSLSHISPRAMI